MPPTLKGAFIIPLCPHARAYSAQLAGDEPWYHAPMKFRKLRIAWSVAWGVVAVLLCVLWVRSYLGVRSRKW